MKTWQVGPKDNEWVAVVHAPTRGKAREMLTDEVEWTYIRAVRLPELDNKPVTKENLIAAGFPEEWEGEPIDPINYTWFCRCELCKGAI